MKLCIILLVGFCMGALSMNAQKLTDYQWKNRILLLVDTSSNSKDLMSQTEELSKVFQGIEERDLILFTVTRDTVFSNGNPSKIQAKNVYMDYKISPKFKGVVLLGKDGGIKLKQKFVVKPQQIFDLIDGMPMRRAEMRAQKKY